MPKIISEDLRKAREDYEGLFKEKPSAKLSISEIQEIIKDANEKFERDFP